MEQLKMYCNNLLFAQEPIEYSGMKTPLERQLHQERRALEMLRENWHLLSDLTGVKVVFCVEPVPSKM